MAVCILEVSDFEGIVPDRHARIGIKQDLVVAAAADGGSNQVHAKPTCAATGLANVLGYSEDGWP